MGQRHILYTSDKTIANKNANKSKGKLSLVQALAIVQVDIEGKPVKDQAVPLVPTHFDDDPKLPDGDYMDGGTWYKVEWEDP